jgi:ABC-type multidrug transport system fused ATPase/permease subunit
MIQTLLYKEYSKKTDVEKQISELQEKHKQEIDIKVKDVQGKLEKTIQSQDNQLQEGANKLYGANEAFKYYQTPQRLDIIINNRVTEAQAAIGKAPTYKAIQEENERLKKELDEKLTTLEELRNKHTQVVAENTKLSEETVKAKKEVELAKAEWLKTEQKYISDSALLNSKLKDANDKIIELEKKRADHEAAVERMKTKMMIWCGIGAVVALAGAIYSPVGKRGLAIIAGVLGGAAAAIPFIEPWMIGTAIFVVLAGVLIAFLNKYRVAEKTTDNLVNHIEDVKTQLKTANPELLSTVKQSLKEWNTNYTKDGKTVHDTSVDKFIKERLKQYGRL